MKKKHYTEDTICPYCNRVQQDREIEKLKEKIKELEKSLRYYKEKEENPTKGMSYGELQRWNNS